MFDATGVSMNENGFVLNGRQINIYKEADAANLPWGELGVDVVLECTGFYTSEEKAMAHINAGAKHVIISAPAKGNIKTIIDQGLLEDELEEALNKNVDIIFDTSYVDDYFEKQIMEDMIKLC
jgi:glyceraldehyde-3-phosphate dehydrogenase/erythrose-4-phosphate dehydrogenase